MSNKNLNDALEEGVWAIAITPGGKYIGQLWGIDHSVPSNEEYFVEHLGNPVYLRYPLEFASMFVPRQMPGGQVGFDRVIQAYCLSRCYDVETSEIVITPVDIVFFKGMSRNDRDWHKDLIRTGIKGAVEARMKASGLLVPAGGMQEGNA